jgi:head-tail adaptor
VRGGELVRADGVSGRASHEIWIRSWPDISRGMRFRDGPRAYRIHAVLSGERPGRMKCVCEEIWL